MSTDHSYDVVQTAKNDVDVQALDTEIRTRFALASEVTASPTVISFSTVNDLGQGDTTLLHGIIAAHAGHPGPVANVKVELEPRTGSKVQIYTSDFSDKATWVHTATRVTDRMMHEGSENVWCVMDMMTDVQLVNVVQGKVTLESRYRTTHGVFVRDGNGDPLVEHSADSIWNGKDFSSYASGDGDYAVDYERGRVHLTRERPKPIRIDFHQVVDSEIVIAPTSGKILELLAAEMQIATNASLRDDWNFQLRGVVDKDPNLLPLWDAANVPFAAIQGTPLEALWLANPAGAGPYPAGTKLPLATNTYHTVMDLVSEANNSYPPLLKTKNASPSWRDLLEDLQIFRWDYELQAKISLYSSRGNDVRIWFSNHTPIKAWRANATFYGRSISEE